MEISSKIKEEDVAVNDDSDDHKGEMGSFIKAEIVAHPQIDFYKKEGIKEIFYDSSLKAFLLRNKDSVILFQGGEYKKMFKIPQEYENHQRVQHFILTLLRKKIFDMSLNRNQKIIAYSVTDSTLVNNKFIIYLRDQKCFFKWKYNCYQQVIINLVDGREMRIKIQGFQDNSLKSKWIGNKTQNPLTQQIMFFTWIEQHNNEQNIDFILCERSGVRLYKIQEEKSILKEVKVYEIQCSAYWYDPIGQTLLIGSQKENGKLYSFFFGERKSQLKYKGPEFWVEDLQNEKKSVDIFLKLINGISSIIKQNGSEENSTNTPDSKFSFHSFNNKLLQIQSEIGEQCECQAYIVNVYWKSYFVFIDQVEGKIVLYHLLFEKITKLDWKISVPSDSFISVCVIEDLLLFNIHQNSISMIFDIKRSQQMIPIGPPQPITLTDNKVLYDQSIRLTGDEWIIDSESSQLFRFVVDLKLIHQIVEGEIECFNIILRRNNPKTEAIEFIRSRISQQKKLTHICTYFKHIFSIYKEAQKDQNLQETSYQQDNLKNVGNKQPQNCLKIKQGYAVIFPSELHQELLTQVVRDQSNEIAQILKTQELLIEVILKEQNYNILHSLIQYKTLQDTSELAKKLIQISLREKNESDILTKRYVPGFQLGIDMLFRLKKNYDIAEIFFSNGMFLEAMDLIQKLNLYGKLKAKSIATWCNIKDGNCRRSEVIKFFEYLISSHQYLSYQSQNQGSNPNQSNKLQFNAQQLQEEFKKAKEVIKKQRTSSAEKIRQKANPQEESTIQKLGINEGDDTSTLRDSKPFNSRPLSEGTSSFQLKFRKVEGSDTQNGGQKNQSGNIPSNDEVVSRDKSEDQKNNFIEKEESQEETHKTNILHSQNEESFPVLTQNSKEEFLN